MDDPPRVHRISEAPSVFCARGNSLETRTGEPPPTDEMTFAEPTTANILSKRIHAQRPRELFFAQDCLRKAGMRPSHAATLLNIIARWQIEPNKPVSIHDWGRLYGITRNTGRKLLNVLVDQMGFTRRDVKRHSGADNGFVLTYPKQAKTHECAVDSPRGGFSTDPGGGSMNPGGELCGPGRGVSTDPLLETLTRSSSKNLSLEPEELSPTPSVEPPAYRGESRLIIQTAVDQFEAWQKQLGGIRTDHQTVDSLMQQTVGWSDDDVANACGVALHLTNAWVWSQDRPSACPAGMTISAVIQGTAWSPVPGVDCTPDVGETFTWDSDAQTFVDEVGFDVFECPVETPLAVDGKDVSEPPAAPVETVLEVIESQSTRPIEACLPESPSPTLQFISTPSNGPEVQPRSYGSVEEQLARLRAVRPDLCPTSRSTGRYGSPHGDDEGGCGEDYFNALEAQRKSVPAELPF